MKFTIRPIKHLPSEVRIPNDPESSYLMQLEFNEFVKVFICPFAFDLSLQFGGLKLRSSATVRALGRSENSSTLLFSRNILLNFLPLKNPADAFECSDAPNEWTCPLSRPSKGFNQKRSRNFERTFSCLISSEYYPVDALSPSVSHGWPESVWQPNVNTSCWGIQLNGLLVRRVLACYLWPLKFEVANSSRHSNFSRLFAFLSRGFLQSFPLKLFFEVALQTNTSSSFERRALSSVELFQASRESAAVISLGH